MASVKNIWYQIRDLLDAEEIQNLFKLLLEYVEEENGTIWQWEILIDDFNIFPQEKVNYLLTLTSGVRAITTTGEMIEIPTEIKTVASEIFSYIADTQGDAAVKAFERALVPLREDPSLTYEFWLNLRLKLGFNSDLEDSLIYAASFSDEISQKPIYLKKGTFNPYNLSYQATITPPEYNGGSINLYNRELQKYRVLQTQKRLDLSNSAELARLYGPSNKAAGMDYTIDSPCTKFGGCRMLICECYEEDWFLGYCQVCLKKIPYKTWAMRLPILTGSWTGCFCSPGCALYKVESEGEPMDVYLLSNIWEKIKALGIYDTIL